MFDSYLLDTRMTILVFSITIFECLVLVLQGIYYLQRPDDKKRLWYLLFLVAMVVYNLAGGFFPDPHIEWINFKMQVISTFFLGAGVSMYFSFYVYKAFDLHYLKWFATHGAFYFIFLPLIFTFVIPYSITGQLEFYSKLVVIIPGLYGASWVYLIYKAFDKEFDNIEDDKLLRFKKKEMVAVYIALAFWMTMPFSTFINVENQIWQQGMASAGFLVMSIAYVAVQVNQSRYEYQSTMSKMDELTKAQKN